MQINKKRDLLVVTFLTTLIVVGAVANEILLDELKNKKPIKRKLKNK